MTKEVKEVVLTKKSKGYRSWAIHYSPREWLEQHPNDSLYYTTVTKKECPEIEDLKKGDVILVTTVNQGVKKVSSI